jgi:hypothetical protein
LVCDGVLLMGGAGICVTPPGAGVPGVGANAGAPVAGAVLGAAAGAVGAGAAGAGALLVWAAAAPAAAKLAAHVKTNTLRMRLSLLRSRGQRELCRTVPLPPEAHRNRPSDVAFSVQHNPGDPS